MKIIILNKKINIFKNSKGDVPMKVIGFIVALVVLIVMVSIFIRYIRTGGSEIVSCDGKGENFRCQDAPCGEGAKEVPFDCENKNQICCYNAEGYEDTGEENGENGDGGSGSKDESYATINLYGEQEGIGQIKGTLNVKAEEEKTVYIGMTGKGISQDDNGCVVYLYDDVEKQYLRIDDAPVRKYFKCSLPQLSSFSFTLPNSAADKDISLQVIAYKENCGEDNVCQGVEDWAGSYKVELEIELVDKNPPTIDIESLTDYWEEYKTIDLTINDMNAEGELEFFNPRFIFWEVSSTKNCPQNKEDYEYNSIDERIHITDAHIIDCSVDYTESYLCVYVEDDYDNFKTEAFGPLKIAPKCGSQDCSVIVEDPCYCGQGSGNKIISSGDYYCAGLCKDYYTTKETCEFHLNGGCS
ncbi:hypothetical protein JW949_01110 [Candidatus Woesearchaeota archaeon]|nr:hypothetical protein [Candidatus Woesearchaeota archaeon]